MKLCHAMIIPGLLAWSPALWAQSGPTPPPGPEALPDGYAEASYDVPVHPAQLAVATTTTTTAASPAISGGSGTSHKVMTGETLYRLSIRYGVAVAELERANGLVAGGVIRVGQTLVIPVSGQRPQPAPPEVPKDRPAPTGWDGSHRVAPGESLTVIARKHGVPMEDLAAANGISDPNRIAVGQSLRVPSGSAGQREAEPAKQAGPAKQPDPVPPVTETQVAAEETYHYYDVQKGDTISSIAAMFFTTGQEVAKLNNIPLTATLKVGQQLVVPTKLYFEDKRRRGEMI